ncbi:condensation domain-containing protein [Nocardia barduliensis]|uniref:condensation domain-containing protein n=1 Tax=Nocardia barduliensis TaxID=2736643 RepID=UPI001572239E|nr:condensation domain-containing protein [Nocardia barduliensis]
MRDPADDVAEIVREIWLAELAVDDVDVTDNFFALGGESIGAAAVVTTVNRRLGVAVRLKDFYLDATLGALTAHALRESGTSHADRSADQMTTHPDTFQDGPRRASLAQEWNLMFTERASQADAEPFLVQQALRLRGPLDSTKIQRTLDGMADRHELLRATFRRSGDSAFLDIAPTHRFALQTFDLGEGAQRARMRTEADRAFDRYAAPMARCQLFSLSPNDHVLLFVLDHIIADGFSLDILLHDFSEIYEGNELPPVTTPFTAWAASQRRCAADPAAVESYWRDRLGSDPTITSTPFTDYRHPAEEKPECTSITLAASETAAVRDAARGRNLTVYSLVLGSFLVSLRDRVREREFCIVTTMANRTGETADTFGPLAHDIYVPVDLTADRDLSASAAYAQQSTAESLTHALVPNTAIAEMLWPGAGPEMHLLPSFYFSANRAWTGRFQLTGVHSEDLRFAPQTPMPGLECTLTDSGRQMVLTLGYLADSFPPGYVHTLGREVIERILADHPD